MTDTEAPEATTPEEPSEQIAEKADEQPQDEVAERPEEQPAKRPDWWVRHYTFTGTAVGLVFLWLSMTPSLLPRGPLFQGLVSGAAGAIGYGIGVFVVWLVRFMMSKPTSPPPPKYAWIALIVLGVIITLRMVVVFHDWQDHIRDMMGVARLVWTDYLIAAVLSIVVLFVLVEIGQLIGKLIRFLVRQLNRVAPPRVSAAVAVVLVVVLFIAILNGVVLRLGMQAMNNTFEAVNNEMSPDSPPPTSAKRSGGPKSLVTWASLGNQGRTFVDNGPSMEQLSKFNGAPAVEPIRAYAGLESADGIKAAADLAAQELVNMGGLTRKVIAVATTTGTGWINEAEAESIEYMYNGDTAIVSMQYSFLPSWLSFLVDKENARQSGQALFEAVSARVRALPEGQRPKLVVFGESLGSFGGEAPFLSVNNILARTDGALFSGPTFNNTMWQEATGNRDAGSPEWLPIYQDGRNVRFSARASDDLGRPDAPWGHPRVVYLQHASDPITWWNPDLLFKRPDWLEEKPGYDRVKEMSWFPVVSFLQVSADMAVAVDVPDGHGHRYVKDVVNAWAAILQPPGWTPEKTQRLREIVTAPE
ncbi:MAG TPA: alpha/beta-hydrolase family protein [Mycobacterium sp.]|nr:alpha/beta-hydrolase family protein [Mycobacterium sp.]